MRFALSIQQNVSRFDVTVQNSVFMRVMHNARDFRDEFHRLPHRHWRAPNDFIKLPAFNEFHAEITGAIAFAYFVDWNDAGMIETCDGLRFPTETFHVRFAGPLTKVNDF